RRRRVDIGRTFAEEQLADVGIQPIERAARSLARRGRGVDVAGRAGIGIRRTRGRRLFLEEAEHGIRRCRCSN
ncbi:MAG TPA: hypothetical protein VFF43_17180, partial [Caldimonas sp.]|nr:hypothetical protein [Caldimonas sp.]